MPKIIKDLKPHILETVQTLIDHEGYAHLNMRSIAKASGIAVGTLYNYYDNKEMLLLQVLEISWQKTLENIQVAIQTTDHKIEMFLSVLYDDVISRKGLGRMLLPRFSTNDSATQMEKIFRQLEVDFEALLINESIADSKRKKVAVIMSLIHLFQRFPEEKEANIAYLLKTL